MDIIKKNIASVAALCQKHKVNTLYAFGSVLTNKFKTSSDVDLIVDFDIIDVYEYADNYFDLKAALEAIFNRDVDLLEEKAVKNPYLRQSIDASKN